MLPKQSLPDLKDATDHGSAVFQYGTKAESQDRAGVRFFLEENAISNKRSAFYCVISVMQQESSVGKQAKDSPFRKFRRGNGGRRAETRIAFSSGDGRILPNEVGVCRDKPEGSLAQFDQWLWPSRKEQATYGKKKCT